MIRLKIILTVLFLLAFNVITFSQVGIGTDQPNASAAIELSSATQGFIPPRMTRQQMIAIQYPAEGLIIYCTDCTPKGLYVSDGEGFYNSSDTPPAEVTSNTGRIWLDRDIGARRAATSEDDYLALGHLFQWGRDADGHEYVLWGEGGTAIELSPSVSIPGGLSSIDDLSTVSGSFVSISNVINSWADFPEQDLFWQNGFKDPCPEGFSVPSASEWDEEINSWSTKDRAGAFASPLKIPYLGTSRTGITDNVSLDNFQRIYWAKDNVSAIDPGQKGGLVIINEDASSTQAREYTAVGRVFAFPVRCIKNQVQDNAPKPVYSSTGKIWLDRNLGATRVARYSRDYKAYGSLFQWGRDADGHEVINWISSNSTDGAEQSRERTGVSTTATPGNSDFYVYDGVNPDSNWLSLSSQQDEDALWKNGINNPCPDHYRVPTQVELLAEITGNLEQNFNTVLRLPGVISRDRNSTIPAFTISYNYWTSTVASGDAIDRAVSVVYPEDGVTFSSNSPRNTGHPVRCIYDEVPTVVSSTGRIWMDRDLGASRVAQSADDFQAYGSLFQWGRKADAHELINYTDAITGTAYNPTTTTQATTAEATNASFVIGFDDWTTFDNDGSVLWPKDSKGVNDPCPTGFKVPSLADWEAEIALFSSSDMTGAFSSPLKLTQGGFRWGDQSSGGSGGNVVQPTSGFYWTANGGVGSASRVRIEAPGGNAIDTFGSPRANGMSVRCIKEE